MPRTEEIIGTTETLTQLWIAVINRHKDLRQGQALMNELYTLDPAMYEIISNNSTLNCYYDDKLLAKTVEYLITVYK